MQHFHAVYSPDTDTIVINVAGQPKHFPAPRGFAATMSQLAKLEQARRDSLSAEARRFAEAEAAHMAEMKAKAKHTVAPGPKQRPPVNISLEDLGL